MGVGEGSSAVLPGRRHIIERPRLTRLLDECEARVILLVAPAGYGKTTLANEWTSEEGKRAAWCRLRARAGDVASLAQLLAGAVDRVIPGSAARVQARLAVSSDPESEVVELVKLLCAGIEEWPRDAWLVIDDYHTAPGASADRFFENFIEESHGQFVITSRSRPTWATARKLMYGEIHEIGPAALAMTHDEAFQVLGSRSASSRGFFALADGWPAVIGLAAIAGPSVMTTEPAPADLYDFVAEEVFGAISPAAQRSLCLLALAPVLDDVAVRAVVDGGEESVDEAVRAGLLIRREAGFDLHPLLRVFLTRKLREETGATFSALIGEVGRALIECGRWDDALSLAEEHSRTELIERSLEEGLATLLREGRLESIRRATEVARLANSQSGIVYLAAAEVALREGSATKARALAESALDQFVDVDRHRARALVVIGRSAHQADEYVLGFEAFRSSREVARTAAEKREALWGMFLCACQLDRPDATEILNEFEAEASNDVESTIRVGIGRQVDGERRGCFGAAVNETAPLIELLPYVRDPLVRSSYLSGRARMLAVMSKYDDARMVVKLCHEAIQADQLTFGLPSTLATEAITAAGMRRFRQALSLLKRCELEARHLNDLHNTVDASAIRVRLLTAIGRSDEAAKVQREWDRHPGPMMWAEFLASIALAVACLGQRIDAENLIAESAGTSANVHSRVLSALARAILAARLKPTLLRRTSCEAFELVVDSDHFDSFVTAYRAVPELLAPLAQSLRPSLERLYERVPDPELGRALGLQPKGSRLEESLTAREAEVYALIIEGLTNREIAKRLFISEVTVKVHVRHILAKLGVRSRIQAALVGREP